MPAFNAARLLPQVLPPLIEMRDAGEVSEVIVVDDRSTDGTAALAMELTARIIVAPVNGGPGAARNLAASEASGSVLWFVDSDVIARHEGAARIRMAFADPGVAAVFGSYDDAPGSLYWFSQYRNLLHHFHHQNGNQDASTFWAGCGAVRKDVFLALGGFDTKTYEVPSIEDIELGYRIRAAGHRIVMDPSFLCKHLKHWTIRNAMHTDIFKRALPWSRLMIAREGLADDLNTGTAERARAMLALILIASLVVLPFAPGLWPLPLVLFLVAILANISLFRLLWSRRGLGMALASIAYHQVYYLYSAGVFAWCLFEFHVLGQKDKLGVFK